jgi:hypothetical protein
MSIQSIVKLTSLLIGTIIFITSLICDNNPTSIISGFILFIWLCIEVEINDKRR